MPSFITQSEPTIGSPANMMTPLHEAISGLLQYCKNNDWAGYDPYDALNSRIFQALPFSRSRLCRVLFTQAMKRSPLNLRPLLLVPQTQNPKAIALFLSSLINLDSLHLLQQTALIKHLASRLLALRSNNSPYWSWGYNFDWQSRDLFVPKFTSNIICTTFAANALLDTYDKFPTTEYLRLAISAGDFFLHGLNTTGNHDEFCFSYTPLDRSQVHNANLLAAAFLARLYARTNETRFVQAAHSAVRFSARRQNPDGSWAYGEARTQKWIDNFHTGYNLVALKSYSEYSGETSVDQNLRTGFRFYKENFFTRDGIPKYFHNRKYPIDIHSVAQSIITLVECKALDNQALPLAQRTFRWASKHMQGTQVPYFYRVNRLYRTKISYMRWSQAWMLYAMSILAHALLSQTTPYLHKDAIQGHDSNRIYPASEKGS